MHIQNSNYCEFAAYSLKQLKSVLNPDTFGCNILLVEPLFFSWFTKTRNLFFIFFSFYFPLFFFDKNLKKLKPIIFQNFIKTYYRQKGNFFGECFTSFCNLQNYRVSPKKIKFSHDSPPSNK